jgi:hypothetical protein
MMGAFPGVGPESAWSTNGFAWIEGNRLAVNHPHDTHVSEFSDPAIPVGSLAHVRVNFTVESAGPIQISVRGGDWRDLDFDEGLDFAQTEAIAGTGSGYKLRGGTTGAASSVVAIIEQITATA